MKIVHLIAFGLFLITSPKAMENTPDAASIASSRVLLGEGHTDAKNYGCFKSSSNYDGETSHHLALNYCTVSLEEEVPQQGGVHEKAFLPDIIGHVKDPSVWELINTPKRNLIADMTYIHSVTESSFVTEKALAALNSGGHYLLPVLLSPSKAQWIVKADIGDNLEIAEKTLNFNQIITNYGILIGGNASSFPAPELLENGSNKIEELLSQSFPQSDIRKAELKPSPLLRAFWRLPKHTQNLLQEPVESRVLRDYFLELMRKHMKMSFAESEEAYVKLDKANYACVLSICYHLSQASDIKKILIENAKQEAMEEAGLFGNFFGPQGTTFSWSYDQDYPLGTIPAYILVTKN